MSIIVNDLAKLTDLCAMMKQILTNRTDLPVVLFMITINFRNAKSKQG